MEASEGKQLPQINMLLQSMRYVRPGAGNPKSPQFADESYSAK